MGVNLTKDSIDLGVITNDPEPMIAFYRDVLGFTDGGTMPLPGGHMQRLMCGTSAIKIVTMKKRVAAKAAPGGLGGATGYRYWTMRVGNLAEILLACEKADITIAVPLTEFAPGVSLAIVEDPDGNWVEFVQGA